MLPRFLQTSFQHAHHSAVARRLARGALWSLGGTLLSRGLTLLSFVFVARLLGQTGFGELGLVRSTVGMLGVFAGFGLGLTATKHVAQYRDAAPDRAGRIIGLSTLFAAATGLLMSSGLAILAPWLARTTLDAPHLSTALRIGSLLLFAEAMNGVQLGALAGFEAFKTMARISLLSGVLSLPILVGGAYLGSIDGAVGGLAACASVNCILNHWALRREARRWGTKHSFSGCTSEWPVLWSFSIPALLGGALVGPVNWGCAAILVNQPDGYAELAVYTAANQWFEAILFLPRTLGGVVLPVLTSHMAAERGANPMRTVPALIAANSIIVFPAVIAGSMAAPGILGLYGPGYSEQWLTLVVVLVTAAIVSAQAPVGQLITASGRMWVGFLMNASWAVIVVIATVLLVRYGALGLALSRAGSYFAHAVWTLWYAAIAFKGLDKQRQ